MEEIMKEYVLDFLPTLYVWIRTILIFLLILWVGKFISRQIAKLLDRIVIFERLKVEGVMDLPQVMYYALLVATWYLALLFVGINLSAVFVFLFTNISILLAIAAFSFGLAWALHRGSQEQAHRIITHIMNKVREIFTDPQHR